jgi:hypothetical protein
VLAESAPSVAAEVLAETPHRWLRFLDPPCAKRIARHLSQSQFRNVLEILLKSATVPQNLEVIESLSTALPFKKVLPPKAIVALHLATVLNSASLLAAEYGPNAVLEVLTQPVFRLCAIRQLCASGYGPTIDWPDHIHILCDGVSCESQHTALLLLECFVQHLETYCLNPVQIKKCGTALRNIESVFSGDETWATSFWSRAFGHSIADEFERLIKQSSKWIKAAFTTTIRR